MTHSADQGCIRQAGCCRQFNTFDYLLGTWPPAEATRHRPLLSPRPVGSAGVTDRDDLLAMIKQLAVVRGEVILSSGQRSDWYIDLRRVLLDGRAAPLAGRVMLDTTKSLSYDAVGGLTLGADPVAIAMLHAASARGGKLDAFVVRKAEKAHGLQRRIEGPDVAGRRVLAVEDTSTTGGSVLTAVDALQEAGAEVVGVAVVVERGARPKIAERGLPYLPAFELADLGLD